jgi:nascent polypeptide-associated complex subunit beta
MDPAKLAKLQAQAAANRIGMFFSSCLPLFKECHKMVPHLLAKMLIRGYVGGKGTMRRKIVRKAKPSAAQDDKKLQGALKKLNVQPIPGVEEVNMFREDGNVLHFTAPKGELHGLRFYRIFSPLCENRYSFFHSFFQVHAAVSANTFAIYGTGQVKELTELVPGILNQLGPDSLASLRKLAESYQSIQQGQQKPPNAGADDDDDDDDVPDLVENFDVEGEQKAKLEELN